MSKGKIIKMPVKHLPERKEDKGGLSVNCELTYRWLQFYGVYSDSQDRKVALVNVMTTNIDGVDRKICGLAVSVDELLRAIKQIQDEKDK